MLDIVTRFHNLKLGWMFGGKYNFLRREGRDRPSRLSFTVPSAPQKDQGAIPQLTEEVRACSASVPGCT